MPQQSLRTINVTKFASVPQLIAAIEEFTAANNDKPKPFVWTASVEKILKKIGHCKTILGTLH